MDVRGLSETGLTFIKPFWWLVLPILGLFCVYLRLPWLRLARAGGGRAWRRECRRLGIRCVLLALVVAVLAGTQVLSTVHRQAVVLALDVSASMGSGKVQGEEWARKALAAKPPAVLGGVVAFGQQALVEEPLAPNPSWSRQETDPGADGSRIGDALRLAGALFPGDVQRRIVLLSDGRDTSGEAVAEARQLRAEGVRLDVVPIGGTAGPDMRVDGVKLPARAQVGNTVALEVSVSADVGGAGTLLVTRDGVALCSQPVQLRSGENRISIPVDAGAAGMHRYDVQLVSGDKKSDTFAANDTAGAIQEVTGPPRVLVVADRSGGAGFPGAAALVQALHAAGKAEITVAGGDEVPRGAAAWANYQAVFLVNVPALSLGEKTMSEIETYVRDSGGGLVMIGGNDSFGPGGYAGSPVERALPVDMNVSGKGEIPSLGLVLVIDKSGSMEGMAGGAAKIELAKEAAARAVSLLSERDRLGVIAFDSLPWDVVPLQAVKDKDGIRQAIGSIAASDGTEIFPPLVDAYQVLKNAPVKLKHVILLTDGMSASGGEYQQLTQAMREAGITLTCVAVGPDADAGMLRGLAELGHGRFYATSDANTIPAIFTKETVMITRSFTVNERFYPQQTANSPLLKGIEQVPPLEGYVATTAKDRAEVVLLSHRGEPVLASWQYGLGRAVAWTPDAAGRWSASWISDQVFPRLWGNVLSWMLPATNNSPVQVQAETGAESANGGHAVHLTVDDPLQWQQVKPYEAVLTGPTGLSQRVALTAAGPGRYAGEVNLKENGAYLVTITTPSGNSQAAIARTGLVISYSAEYRQTGVDMGGLKALAAAGGGSVLQDPGQAFAGNLPPVRASHDISLLLLVLAALLWLLDVAGRRLVLEAEEFAALKQFLVRLATCLSARDRGQPVAAPRWSGRLLKAVDEMRRDAGQGRKEVGARPHGGAASGSRDAGLEPPPPAGSDRIMDEKQGIDVPDRAENTASQLLEAKRRRRQ